MDVIFWAGTSLLIIALHLAFIEKYKSLSIEQFLYHIEKIAIQNLLETINVFEQISIYLKLHTLTF